MADVPHRRPRRIVARTLAFGIGTLVAAGAIAWTPTAASAWNQGSAEATLWQLLNGSRANNGIRPLQQHSTLVGLARWRSSDMLAKNYFSHTIAGCGCLVYAYYDSNGLSYQWAGENIGWNSGQTDANSPIKVHEQFMSSAGHRANVLDARFTHGGVGAAAADGKMFQGYVQNTRMFTELFMQSSSSAPAPPPSGGGGGGSGGGGGGGGSSGGAAAPAPAPAVAAKPKPTAKHLSVEAPRRPASSAGLDGAMRLVSAPDTHGLIARHLVDVTAAARASTLAVAPGPAIATTAASDMEVAAAPVQGGDALGGLVGAILGFLFG